MDGNNVYVYIVEQANFFMKMINCKGTGKNLKTGEIFYVFDKEESKKPYKLWKIATLNNHTLS